MDDRTKRRIQNFFYIMPIVLWGFSMSSLAVRTWRDAIDRDVLLRVLAAVIAGNGLVGVYYLALSIFADMQKKYAFAGFAVCTLFTIAAFC